MKLTYPVKYEKVITQKFGERPEYYSQYKIGGVPLKGHEGLDLRAPDGTEILACDDGECVEVLDQGKIGYGRYIKILHSWGESVYAHLKEFKVKQGQRVSRSQVIGLADNTGNSTGSHLHFGIRINPYQRDDGWGGYSNPEPYLFQEEQSMPNWVEKLKPYFLELNLTDEQVEPWVREAFGNSKILQGFVEKWVQKLNLTAGSDLSSVENEISKLLEIEDAHTELLSTVEQVVGPYETEDAYREALRAVKKDVKDMSDTTKVLIEENDILRKKRTLDKYLWWQLIFEGFLKLIEELKLRIKGVKV